MLHGVGYSEVVYAMPYMVALNIMQISSFRNCTEYLNNKKYLLSNLESDQCDFFIFDHVTFIQFKICCCVQNFMKIIRFFTEIW